MKYSPAILELRLQCEVDAATETTIGLILGLWRPEEIRALAARSPDLRDAVLDGLSRYLLLRDRGDLLRIASIVDATGRIPEESTP